MNYFTLFTEYFNVVFLKQDINTQLTDNMSYLQSDSYPKTEEDRYRFFNVCGGYLPQSSSTSTPKVDKMETIDEQPVKEQSETTTKLDFVNVSQMLSYYNNK